VWGARGVWEAPQSAALLLSPAMEYRVVVASSGTEIDLDSTGKFYTAYCFEVMWNEDRFAISRRYNE
jgi:hypothetical protein